MAWTLPTTDARTAETASAMNRGERAMLRRPDG